MDMENRRDLFDYRVIDRNGNEIGDVQGLWADEATGRPEFASVKTGWLLGREHVVPIREGQIDSERREIRLSYDKETVKDAPSFETDHDLSPGEEAQIYQHYRLERSHARSPTGLPGERLGAGLAGREPARLDAWGEEEIEMPLREEKVDVGRRTVDEGEVHLRKIVRTDTVREPVELRRETVDVERLPAGELQGRGLGEHGAMGQPFEEGEVVLHERREEPVVDKHTEITGGVRATKDVDTERRDVEAEVRREDVEIDRQDRKDSGLF